MRLKKQALTPVFQRAEWKDKQKQFFLETKELIEIEYLRGCGKFPQIVRHSGDFF